uniref:NADH-ubiquinone oxidoreductase chain 2 n=1 Tax=Geothelphusa sakamotoana TaxID=394955 RepID=A0A6F8Z2Z5_9EUCA|nr:NADH dehydrogenase subunit 2 [Geothelphusa sakamotoana]BCD33783.1 NADH dehydrogenase subunit 2 [Geothelphusa sakamotoana]BCD33785.1 NADH dehydrogenase subunit 2 [Geothelphusa sakamotoana]BCD33786.1 NADH dehydrogenase subunit 2 [Geothelphusa sakamotoana]BCD33789.1 NADH dehydrogenase subunit 2 [Geothelphusa sakamotoana]
MVFPFSYTLFFFCLILGIFISISSPSWFSIWIGLELNMLSFIPLITIKMNFYFSESALKYFLIQALGSTLFILSSCMFLSFPQMSPPLLLTSLFLKLGSAPFHFWFPQVMSGLIWPQAIILMTLQKIPPMILISYLSMNSNLIQIISFSAILSAIIGALGGFNTTQLRKILAFSSINHMSWMLISISISDTFWTFYFLFYSMISLSIVVLFNILQTYTLSDLMKFNQTNSIHSLLIPFNLLSLGGLPPLAGFIPKWMLIQLLINNNFYFTLIFLLSSTLITLYFYLRITIFFLLLINPSMSFYKNSNSSPFSLISNSFLFSNLFMFFLPIMFLFF